MALNKHTDVAATHFLTDLQKHIYKYIHTSSPLPFDLNLLNSRLWLAPRVIPTSALRFSFTPSSGVYNWERKLKKHFTYILLFPPGENSWPSSALQLRGRTLGCHLLSSSREELLAVICSPALGENSWLSSALQLQGRTCGYHLLSSSGGELVAVVCSQVPGENSRLSSALQLWGRTRGCHLLSSFRGELVAVVCSPALGENSWLSSALTSVYCGR